MGKGDRERERLREERIEAEKRDKRSGSNRLMLTYAIASTAVLAIVVLAFVLLSGGDDGTTEGGAHINTRQEMGSTNGVEPDDRSGAIPPPVKVFDLEEAAEKAGCDLELKLEDEGSTHIPQNSPAPIYKTNPPTSGNHVEPPYQQADGAYSESPDQLNVVHSLEHGRLAIQYKADLPDKAQLELKGLYDTMYGASLLFPYDRMPYEVAATTWTNMLGCKKYEGAKTLDAIAAFGKETWGKFGGEAVPAKGPTPRKPEA